MATMLAAGDPGPWRPLSDGTPRPGSVGAELVYAIGDIHGCYALFTELLALIAADAQDHARGRTPVLVLCGDYIDRGPASAQVIEAVLWLQRHGDYDLRVLRGNHEQCLLDFIATPAEGASWLRFGGEETLRAYGVTPPPDHATEATLTAARDTLLDQMPAAHLRLLEATTLSEEIGDYLFVHAGVRPDRPLDQQSHEDLLWIREDFLDHDGPLDRIVVHGHSWRDAQPQLAGHRIGLDTGAFATDVLTALRLDGSARAIAQAGLDGAP